MSEKLPTRKALKKVETLTHEEASRLNIPTAEYQSLIQKEYQDPIRVAYERRNRDLDPQLVWRGKDMQDWSDLVVNAPPIYIQEKVHPKVLIDDLVRRTQSTRPAPEDEQINLFADFNGLPTTEAKTEFYQHDANWSNRMILGDSLQVMASLAEREGLRGQVQCIYIDPPYGIKFNSNFQWSTTSRDVKDGDRSQITREPEQVKAFRDTWRDGVNSYLTYLRDRLTAARDLLTESGSIFVQIGDENVHRIRALMDEVFGDSNFVALISFSKTTGLEASGRIAGAFDYLLWYARSFDKLKYRTLLKERSSASAERFGTIQYLNGTTAPATDDVLASLKQNREWHRVFTDTDLTKPGPGAKYDFVYKGKVFSSGERWWGTQKQSLERVAKANRLFVTGRSKLRIVRVDADSTGQGITNNWSDVGGAVQSRSDPKVYVVQTGAAVLQRCILMTTDPGDLILDPTCGSGTASYVSEQWARRWITIDTSRVALALARARIMGARYQYYLLADTPEGQVKRAEVTRSLRPSAPTHGDIRQGFVHEPVCRLTLESIANNVEIDVIWDRFQQTLEPMRDALNKALKQEWEEWQIPRASEETWPRQAKDLHSEWWEQRLERQREIDASIAAKTDYEYFADKPYEDKSKVRVAGPFTVESLSPHRVLGVDENDDLIDPQTKIETRDFVQIILENLRTAGVQQAHKEDKVVFSALTAWPGDLVCAEGRYTEGANGSAATKRAAIFIGPEFGTVSRPDLVAAAREAADAKFDVLIACAFNFDAHSSEFKKLGSIPVLKARMNADLHMAEDLKNTGKGNLFVIFGEPDIDLLPAPGGKFQVRINGVDVFHPANGEVRSDGPSGIACWFLDTDYNEESFFVRHAYFLGANDPYKSLKTTLKAEIDEDA